MARYNVRLSRPERAELLRLTHGGTLPARKMLRAQILLQADAGNSKVGIAANLSIGRGTVQRICRRCCEEGLQAALNERPRPGGQRKLDGKQEAFLIALACSDPPEGRQCWTMQLLADRLVELELVEEISDETVRRTLKRGR